LSLEVLDEGADFCFEPDGLCFAFIESGEIGWSLAVIRLRHSSSVSGAVIRAALRPVGITEMHSARSPFPVRAGLGCVEECEGHGAVTDGLDDGAEKRRDRVRLRGHIDKRELSDHLLQTNLFSVSIELHAIRSAP
jgi:hypothetical protein